MCKNKIYPEFDRYEYKHKYVYFKTPRVHRSKIAWMLPEEFLKIEDNEYPTHTSFTRYREIAGKLLLSGKTEEERKKKAVRVPEVSLGGKEFIHNDVHSILVFYLNCEDHKIPVWIVESNSETDEFDYNKPDDVEEEEEDNDIIFKIPTGK